MKIIAEIGNTHEGSVNLAKCFITEAARCGVDAVKFQTHYFEHESLDNAPAPAYFKAEDRKTYFNRTAFTKTEWQLLKEYAEQNCGLEFISSPFSEYATDILTSIGLKTLKIASGEVTNIPLLRYVASKNVDVILSSGMSNWSELDRAIEELKSCGARKITLLQCTTSYPTEPEDAGLNIITEMYERYNDLEIGFSDHTRGTAVAVAARALGAMTFEKHFTLSNKMYGSDAFNAEEPAEFKRYVDDLKAADSALTHRSQKIITKKLSEMKEVFQKSIVLSRDLDAGAIIKLSDLDFKKPGTGICASKVDDVVGKFLIKSGRKDEILSGEMISDL